MTNPLTDDERKALRELAEKSIADTRHIERHTTIDKRFSIYNDENCGIEICRFDYDDVDHEQVDIEARFIASANPLTILKLLDQLQEVERERDSLRAENERMRAALTMAAGQLRYVTTASETINRGLNAEVTDGFYRGAISAVVNDIDSALAAKGET